MATGGEEEHPVGNVDALGRVRDDDDDAAAVGEDPQDLHDLPLVARVETGRGLVEVEQRPVCQQLDADRDPLALAAGELLDRQVGPGGEPELGHHLVGALRKASVAEVRRQPQGAGELELLAHSELFVDEILLGT